MYKRGKYIKIESEFKSIVACVWNEDGEWELRTYANVHGIYFGDVDNVLKLHGGNSCTVQGKITRPYENMKYCHLDREIVMHKN